MKRTIKFISLTLAFLLASCASGDSKDSKIHVESVELNKTSLTLEVGGSEQLTATVLPDNATDSSVTWSSSNSEYVTVSQTGLVSAVKEGSATVTVTTVDGGFTANCSVTVNAPAPVLSSIAVSNAKTSYIVNETFVKPTVTATFSDGSTKVVTSETTFSGHNLAVAGTYTVTASYTHNNVNKTTSYSITVEAAKLLSISLGDKKTSYFVNDTFVKPTVTATFSDGSTSVVTNDTTFSGYNMSVAGTYTVTASYTNNGVTKTTSYSITVSNQPSGEVYTLCTDNELEIDSYVTFASTYTGSGYVMGATQNTNNRSAVAATFTSDTVTITDTMGTFLVKEGLVANTYSFYDEAKGGYLHAASDTQNLLKTSATQSNNSSFKIVSNNNGEIKLVAQGNYSHNTLRFNSSAKIFSCYTSSSNTGNLPYLFYKENVPVYPTSISLVGGNEVYVGDDLTLSVSFEPSDTNKKSLTWKSSDDSIATVDRGVVHGVKAGTATITAIGKNENGNDITATKTITVKNVLVESVSLNKNVADVGFGRTLQLTATVMPLNATNQNVTWSSSDTTIATVDSNGLVTANASKDGSAVITVKTEDGNKTAKCTVNVSELVLDEWTIMVYMSGSDLESGGGAATEDIKELLSINGQPEDVNILYQTGGSTYWYSMSGYISGATSISSKRVQRWEVQNKKIVLKDDSLGQQNMGSSTTLESFVKWGVSNYPAQKYGLIFWNHGGAMAGCCIDDNNGGDCLLNSEIKQALKNVFADSSLKINDKFEFVGYDACLMQVQDIADFNSEFFNYMIASEELENGDGWDYACWIDDVYAKKDTPSILTACCDGFVSQYGTSGNDQTLSWLDLSSFGLYRSAWENLAKGLFDTIATYTSSSKTKFINFLTSSVKYYGTVYYPGYEDTGTFDVKDFINELEKNSTLSNGLSTQIAAVKTAFSAVVKYSAKGRSAGESYGLCFYFDSGSSTAPGTYYTAALTNFTEWRKVVNTYGYKATH